jgi:tetratricopeptide (TPR) repeat protein
MTQVFLSYSRQDAAEVSRLRNDLMVRGIDVWWDGNILPGQDWKHEVREAMKRSSAVILCLSARSQQRTKSYIYTEALDAIAAYRQRRPGEIFIIPVRLSSCEIPSIEIDDTRTLDRLHVVDLFPANRWERGIRRLVESIGQISPEGSPSAEPVDLPTPLPQPLKPLHVPRAPSQEGQASHDVFLCFSSKDAAIGSEMCEALEHYGICCWRATRDIVPGKRYTEQIIDAIVSSRALVLIFSSHSNTSQHVIREVEKAVRQKIAIIPFRVEDVPPTKDMDYLISISQWIDALTPPLSDHYTVLARTLQGILHQRSDLIPDPLPMGRRSPSLGPVVGVCVAVAAIASLVLFIVLRLRPPTSPAVQAPAELSKVAPALDKTPHAPGEGDVERSLKPSASPPPAKIALETSVKSETLPATTGVAASSASKPQLQQQVAKPAQKDPVPTAVPVAREGSKDAIALEHLKQGSHLLESQKLDDALPELLQAIQMLRSVSDDHPELASAYQVLGDLYCRQADYPKAIKAYSDAIRRKDTGELRHARGLAYYHGGYREGDKALTDLTQATLREDGKNRADFHLDRAALLAHKQQFTQAELAYDRATHIEPQNAQAFYNWGLSCAMAGNHARAVEKFTEAIKLDPSPQFYVERGKAYCHLGDKNPLLGEYRKATEDYSEAMKRGRKDAEVYILRGDAFRLCFADRVAVEDYTEAIRLLGKAKKSMAREGLKKQAYYGRGYSHLNLGQTAKALDDALFAKGLDSVDPAIEALLRKARQEASSP